MNPTTLSKKSFIQHSSGLNVSIANKVMSAFCSALTPYAPRLFVNPAMIILLHARNANNSQLLEQLSNHQIKNWIPSFWSWHRSINAARIKLKKVIIFLSLNSIFKANASLTKFVTFVKINSKTMIKLIFIWNTIALKWNLNVKSVKMFYLEKYLKAVIMNVTSRL